MASGVFAPDAHNGRITNNGKVEVGAGEGNRTFVIITTIDCRQTVWPSWLFDRFPL
jgi:hypothetical protein